MLKQMTTKAGLAFNVTAAMGLALGISESEYDTAYKQQCVTEKLKELSAAAQAEIESLIVDYPDGEVSTFDKQEAEARAYLNDSNAETPLLDALSQARELNKDELVSRVIAKADAFATACGAIIGKRQKKEDELMLLTSASHTLEDIAAITW